MGCHRFRRQSLDAQVIQVNGLNKWLRRISMSAGVIVAALPPKMMFSPEASRKLFTILNGQWEGRPRPGHSLGINAGSRYGDTMKICKERVYHGNRGDTREIGAPGGFIVRGSMDPKSVQYYVVAAALFSGVMSSETSEVPAERVTSKPMRR